MLLFLASLLLFTRGKDIIVAIINALDTFACNDVSQEAIQQV